MMARFMARHEVCSDGSSTRSMLAIGVSRHTTPSYLLNRAIIEAPTFLSSSTYFGRSRSPCRFLKASLIDVRGSTGSPASGRRSKRPELGQSRRSDAPMETTAIVRSRRLAYRETIKGMVKAIGPVPCRAGAIAIKGSTDISIGGGVSWPIITKRYLKFNW